MFLSCFSENLICAPRKIITLQTEGKDCRLSSPLEAIAEIDPVANKVPSSNLGPLSSEEEPKTKAVKSACEVNKNFEITQKEKSPELSTLPANGTAVFRKDVENGASANPNVQENLKIGQKPSPKSSPVPPKRSMLPVLKSQLPAPNKQKVVPSRIPIPSSRKVSPPGKLVIY